MLVSSHSPRMYNMYNTALNSCYSKKQMEKNSIKHIRKLHVPDVILARVMAAYCALAFALCAACKSIAELLRRPFAAESKDYRALVHNRVEIFMMIMIKLKKV